MDFIIWDNYKGMLSPLKNLYLIFLFSCVPQGGNITLGPQSQGSLSPETEISSITVTGSQLIINGSNFVGVTHVNLKDPSNGSVKPFEVVSATFSKLISESIDATSIPVNIALELILSNSYGQTSYPVTFTLQPNAVATKNIEDRAVTFSKLDPGSSPIDGGVITWNGSGFVLLPQTGGGGGGSVQIFTGEGIVPANPNPIISVGTIAVDVDTTGDPTLIKIPFFNSQNEIKLDGTSTPPAKLVLSNTVVNYSIFNDGDFVIREEGSTPRDILTIDSTKVSINDPLYVNGQLVCTTTAATCNLTGSTISDVTATAPLVSSNVSGVVNISPGAVNTANNLVQLDGSGRLPAISGQNLTNIVNSITAGTSTYVSPASTGAVTVEVLFGSGNAQRWQPNLDNLGNLNPNDKNVIIGNGTSFEVKDDATFRDLFGLSIGKDVQAYDPDLTTIAGLSPYFAPNANMIVGDVLGWTTQTIPNCASGNVVLGNGSNFVCSTSSTDISGGTLTTFNQVGLQIRAETSAGTPTGELRFLGSNNTYYVGLKADGGTNANTIWTLPPSDGSSGNALITNGSGILSWTNVGGANDVSNSTPTLDNSVARFDGTSGKVIQGSSVIIDDSDNVTGVAAFTSMGNMTVDTNTLVVDASGDKVGIRKTGPAYTLDILGANNSGIHLKQGAESTATSGAFFNGLVLEKSSASNAYALGYNTSDLFSIDYYDGSTYSNLFTLNGTGNGQFKGSVKVGAYTLPSTDGTNGQSLTTNGTGTLTWSNVGGANDVSNAGISTTGNLASFSSGTGKVIQDSGIASANVMTMSLPAVAANRILISEAANKAAVSTGISVDGSNNVTGMGTLNTRTIANWVDGPASAVSTNLAAFSGTTGKLIQDSGLLTANIPTMASNAGATNRVIASGGSNKTLIDSGILYTDLVTKASNFSAANRVVIALNGTSRNATETGYTIPPAVCSTGEVLKSNGTNMTCQADLNSGDVLGPVISTDNAIARFDLITGKVIKNSGVIIDNSNNVTGVAAFTSTGNMTVDTNTLFVDAVNNEVGIGRAVADLYAPLDVVGNIYTTIHGSTNLHNVAEIGFTRIGMKSGNTSDGFTGMQLNVKSTDSAGVALANTSDIAFYTWGNSIAATREVMRITERGRLGIGTANPSQVLDVVGNTVMTGSLTINNNGANSSIFPTGRGTSGQGLTTDGLGNLSWSSVGGANDVSNATPATDNAIARFDGISGKQIQNSGVIISDTNAITGVASMVSTGQVDGGQSTMGANSGVAGTFGCFSNNNFPNSATSYSLCQDDTGLTLLNAPTGQTVQTRINNIQRISVQDTQDTLKIHGDNMCLELGAGVSKETSAGRICYGRFTAGTLGIVGAGTTVGSRAINMWDDVAIQDALSVLGSTTLTGAVTAGSNVDAQSGYVRGNALYTRTNTNDGVTSSQVLWQNPRGNISDYRAWSASGGNFDGYQAKYLTAGGYGYRLVWTESTASPPSVKFEGNITAQSYANNSDRRLKKDITYLRDNPIKDFALNKVLELDPIFFYWKDQPYLYRNPGDQLSDKEKDLRGQYGLDAEDVQKVLPSAISKQDVDDILSIEYAQLTALSIQAIKQLNQKVEALRNGTAPTLASLSKNNKIEKKFGTVLDPSLEKIRQMEKRIEALEGKKMGVRTDPLYNQDRLYIYRTEEGNGTESENEKLKKELALLREENRRIQKQLDAINARLNPKVSSGLNNYQPDHL